MKSPGRHSEPRDGLVLVSASLDQRGGGAAAFGRTLARTTEAFCSELGLDFEILCLGTEGLQLNGRKCRTFGSNFSALARSLLRRQLSSDRPAFLFDHLGPARTQALLPGSIRSPYAVTMLGIEVWRPLSWSRRRALSNARRIAISEHTLERAKAHSPWLKSATVVHPCLEHTEAEKEGVELPLLPETFFLIVGRLSSKERYKGHDEVLQALARNSASDMHLVIAGEGDDRPRLETLAGELGISDRTHFLGFVDSATLAELYRRCRAFVLPSRNEGFGLVYLEAMRAARPCIASRSSAAEEIVMHEETGLVVDPSSDELAHALRLLHEDPARATALGEAGRQRYLDLFTPERFAKELRPTLEALTN